MLQDYLIVYIVYPHIVTISSNETPKYSYNRISIRCAMQDDSYIHTCAMVFTWLARSNKAPIGIIYVSFTNYICVLLVSKDTSCFTWGQNNSSRECFNSHTYMRKQLTSTVRIYFWTITMKIIYSSTYMYACYQLFVNC